MKPVPSTKRWWFWLPLLALAFWLAVFGDKTPSDSALPTPVTTARLPTQATTVWFTPKPNADKKTDSAQGNSSKSSKQNTVDPVIARTQLILVRKPEPGMHADLFATGSWSPPPLLVKAPPPQPIPTSGPPLAPTAPQLPFIFVGKKLEAGTWEVFLARGEQSFVVREGSVIENTYRIDKITPQNVSLTYLPLGQNQSLSIGTSE